MYPVLFQHLAAAAMLARVWDLNDEDLRLRVDRRYYSDVKLRKRVRATAVSVSKMWIFPERSQFTVLKGDGHTTFKSYIFWINVRWELSHPTTLSPLQIRTFLDVDFDSVKVEALTGGIDM
ncbi:hypothetical protein B0H19DRAFT_1289946 [Mycena capillaripes]|nr:hypothetical protein B0H19DRAFT_1289946 [Mycena capillaripes]